MVEMTRREILEFGLAMEKKAKAFYLAALDVVKHPGARQMLKELAAEELLHIRFFERALKGEGLLLEDHLPPGSPSAGIGEHLVAAEIRDHSDPASILVKAIGREMDAIERYQEWASQVPDEELAGLLRKLAAQELAHKDRLERLYEEEFLADN